VLQVDGPPALETLRRDQLARRQRIVRAALRALANADYEQVKVSEVARDSGVALGTLYRYFSSKEHLFAAVILEWQDALRRKLEKQPPAGGTEAERLRDVCHRTIRAFQLQPQFYRVLMVLDSTTDSYAADLYLQLSQQFRASVQTAFTRPFDADCEAVLGVINAVLNGALRSWVMNRATIQDVYSRVDNAIGLIYEYRPRLGLAACIA
jgi:AcrR family transcriptional regulator